MTAVSARPTPAARPSGSARRGIAIALIVLHSDPRPGAEALAAYTVPRAKVVPHYYIDRAGAVMPIMLEQRAARHSGTALWHKRRRNIDQLSIGITLEHTPGTWMPRAQYLALALLVAQIHARHQLPTDALMRWDAPPGPHVRDGALIPVTLQPEQAPAPGTPHPGKEAESQAEYAGPLVLGAGVAPQELWAALVQATFRVRGEGFHSDWAFHISADALGIGAPLARSAPSAQYIVSDGKQYGLQVFAGDTLFNEIPHWASVQRLSELLGGGVPADGLARRLLDATYQATGCAFFASYASHQQAVRAGLGAPLGGNYRITVAGQQYGVQVFACDTLYTPIAAPEAATNWGDVQALSATPPGALADALWAETYKPAGATYDPHAPFQQVAAQASLGAPLSGVYPVTVGGAAYDVQVFARDTLYAEQGGAPQRMSALAHDAKRLAAPAMPPAEFNASGLGSGVVAGILGPSGIESAWLAQNPNAPESVKNLLAQATCLLGYENTIFDALPDSLRALTWGADPSNQSSNSLNYKDICCADLVTLILAAADLNWKWAGPGGANHRMAHYYTPYDGNTLLRAVDDGEPYLPGDILTVSYGGGERADHVMLYVGALGGTLAANGKHYDPAVCNLVEASINYNGGNPAIYEYTQPSGSLNWYRKNAAWVRRGRLLELEQAYRAAGML